MDQNIVSKIIFWAKTHEDIKAIYVFGSRAKGSNGPDSDLDLAVETWEIPEGDAKLWNIWRNSKMLLEQKHLSDLIGIQVDLQSLDNRIRSLTPHVKAWVEESGVLVYQSEKAVM